VSRVLVLARRSRTSLLVGAAASVIAVATTPLGIVVLGVVIGSLNALLAIGLVLIYRSNRVVNFSHGEIGGSAAVLTVLLIVDGWSYFLAVGAGIALAIVTGALVELLVIRRFVRSPRLLLAVATIALAQILSFVSLTLPRLFGRPVVPTRFRTPLSGLRFTVDPVIFDGNHLLVIAAAIGAVAGVTAFLQRTDFGIGVQASAENAERAMLCGIPIRSLSTLVWVIAATLSALSAILQAPITGLPIGVLVGPALLLRGLAAAVVARMQSLPVAVAAAIGLGVFEQSIYFRYGRSTIMDALLVVVILVALLAQRRGTSRADAFDSSTWEAIGQVRPIPAELRRLPEVRVGRVAVLVSCAAAAIVIPWQVLAESRITLATSMVLWSLVGVSLVVLAGWAGQISLGQFGLVGLGAATAGSLMEAGWDFMLATAAAVVVGVVGAVLLGLPALRLRGFFLAVTTLAFAVAMASYALRLTWLVPEGLVDRPVLFGSIDLENELTYYYACLVVLALTVLCLRGIRSSRTGRAIVGVRDNERAAQAFGISAMGGKLAAFALSGAIAGLAGALFVAQQHRLQLEQFQPLRSLEVLTMVVIGGLGSVPGAILGAVYVRGAQDFLQGPGSILATGVGLIALLLVLPKGLGSVVFATRDAILRRVAERRGIIVASLLADRRREPAADVGPSATGNPPAVAVMEHA
jgi:branched-chain amino acid transport system permease protein